MRQLVKYLGLLLIAAGIPTALLDSSAGAELPLLVGLFILFIAREKREDERVIIVKSSSAYIALIIGYGIKLISTNLYSHNLIKLQLTEINHFLILVLSLAIIIFYTRIYLALK